MLKNRRQKNLGFTLIKLLALLAVISTIGFLAVSAAVSLNIARMTTRDGKRKADLAIIREALEKNYKKHGAYTQPENHEIDSSVGCTNRVCTAAKVGCSNRCTLNNYPNGQDWDANSDLRDLITDGFLESLPKDPINNSTYHYTYEPWNLNQDPNNPKAGQIYVLCATLEIGGNYCLTNKD